jgi:hypothetical protein
MILLNGCSFSSGTALKDVKHAYPSLLSEMLDEEIIDLSEESKNNFYMAFELNAYILHKLHNNEELPKIIIWQHSDCMRDHLPNHRYSNTWKPNDLESLLGRLSSPPYLREDGSVSNKLAFNKRYFKKFSWLAFSKINNKLQQPNEQQVAEATKFVKDWGMGSRLEIRIPASKGSATVSIPVGDEMFVVQHLQHAINVYNLQMLCDNLNIRLVNYNYFGLGSKISQDPIAKQIDTKSFVLTDYPNNLGMYNHLLWKGFSQPDRYHFDEAAHLYQAEVLYDYIINNKQFEAERRNFLQADGCKHPLFDYVNDPVGRIQKMDPQKSTLLSTWLRISSEREK